MTVFSEKIGHFSHGNVFSTVKEVAQLDQISCACRGIYLLDSIKVWSYSDEGSARGGRMMRGFFVDFALFF